MSNIPLFLPKDSLSLEGTKYLWGENDDLDDEAMCVIIEIWWLTRFREAS